MSSSKDIYIVLSQIVSRNDKPLCTVPETLITEVSLQCRFEWGGRELACQILSERFHSQFVRKDGFAFLQIEIKHLPGRQSETQADRQDPTCRSSQNGRPLSYEDRLR